jgi:hypothetical protein
MMMAMATATAMLWREEKHGGVCIGLVFHGLAWFGRDSHRENLGANEGSITVCLRVRNGFGLGGRYFRVKYPADRAYVCC